MPRKTPAESVLNDLALSAESPSPTGCSSQKVRRLSRHISQHFDHLVAGSGLKTTQYSLLSHLHRLGGVRPGELAVSLGVDASTLTRNLQPLVAAGWVQLEAGADERSRQVSLTAEGRAKRAEAQRLWRRAQDSFNERLGVELVARLHAVIDECAAALEASEAPPAPAQASRRQSRPSRLAV
jgi:DNA-binding MarR family transcriptional regulator